MFQRMLVPILLGVACTLAGQLPDRDGAIKGRVLNEAGAPIAGAKVHAELHGVAMAKAIRFVESSHDGSFLIDRLEFGKYDVNVSKEEDDYPPTDWSLYADKPATVVDIYPEHPIIDVTLTLGPKAAVVVGTVRDALNGKPLNSGFMVRRSDNPNRYISGSFGMPDPPKFRLLIPSSTNVDLEVSQRGYKTWRYAERVSSLPLRLQPGAEIRLDVNLERAPDESLKSSRFLVPYGYVGWLRLEFDMNGAPPVPEEADIKIFKFPKTGVLKTSSAGPDEGANDEYLFYTDDDSELPIPSDYRNGKGMIWGEYSGFAAGKSFLFGFYVGSYEEYLKHKNAPSH
jgi:hypothetical protein